MELDAPLIELHDCAMALRKRLTSDNEGPLEHFPGLTERVTRTHSLDERFI